MNTLDIIKEYQRNNYRLTLDEIDDYMLLKSIYNNFHKDEILNLLDVYKFL